MCLKKKKDLECPFVFSYVPPGAFHCRSLFYWNHLDQRQLVVMTHAGRCNNIGPLGPDFGLLLPNS